MDEAAEGFSRLLSRLIHRRRRSSKTAAALPDSLALATACSSSGGRPQRSLHTQPVSAVSSSLSLSSSLGSSSTFKGPLSLRGGSSGPLLVATDLKPHHSGQYYLGPLHSTSSPLSGHLDSSKEGVGCGVLGSHALKPHATSPSLTQSQRLLSADGSRKVRVLPPATRGAEPGSPRCRCTPGPTSPQGQGQGQAGGVLSHTGGGRGQGDAGWVASSPPTSYTLRGGGEQPASLPHLPVIVGSPKGAGKGCPAFTPMGGGGPPSAATAATAGGSHGHASPLSGSGASSEPVPSPTRWPPTPPPPAPPAAAS